jgi:hypothetical protein
MALVLKVQSYLLRATKWAFEELPVDFHHEVEVHDRIAHQLLAERQPCFRRANRHCAHTDRLG